MYGERYPSPVRARRRRGNPGVAAGPVARRSREAGVRVSRGLIPGAAALAACGVLVAVPPAAQAGSSAVWTQQTPASSLPAMSGMSMASDAATGTVVLLGGGTSQGKVTETWG